MATSTIVGNSYQWYNTLRKTMKEVLGEHGREDLMKEISEKTYQRMKEREQK